MVSGEKEALKKDETGAEGNLKEKIVGVYDIW